MLLKSDKACEDIDNIWLYIAFDNIAAADKLIFDIDDKFHLLEQNPLIGRIAEDIKIAFREIRLFPVRKYIIIYSPIENGVEIHRIINGAVDYISLDFDV